MGSERNPIATPTWRPSHSSCRHSLRNSVLALALVVAVALPARPAVAAPGPNAPWEGAPFSATAAEIARAAAAVKTRKPADAVLLFDDRRIEFDSSGRETHTHRLVYRVDSPRGVEEWAQTVAYWQPWRQKRPQVRARIITSDAEEHALDPKTLTDSAQQSEVPQVYDDTHIYQGPLPAVAVGAVVEEEIITEDTEPYFTAGAVARYAVGRGVPVLHTRITLDSPVALPLHVTLRLLPDAVQQETKSADHVSRVIEQGTLEPLENGVPNLPDDQAAFPQVEVSTGASWQQIARAYFDLTDSKIRVDDVKRILPSGSQGDTPLQIATRMAAKLHREIRYTGVEFGQARLIPQFPSETLSRKFGDCKDKAAVLVAMLRSAGVPANLALLSAGPGQDVSPDSPGMGLFDHAIVYVPGSPALWIDPTAEYTRVGDLPYGDRGRLALVIAQGTTALSQTPPAAPEQNLERETREFYLAEEGPARISETTETHGSLESEYRVWFSSSELDKVRKRLTSYAKSAYLVDSLTRIEPGSATDFAKPFQLRIEAQKADRGFTSQGEASVGIPLNDLFDRYPNWFDRRTPKGRASEPAEDDAQKPRTADFAFEPFATEWRYRIVPPLGFQVRTLPPNIAKDIGPARLTAEFAKEPSGEVTAILRFSSVKGRYTVAEATAAREAMNDLRDAETMLVNFQLAAQVRLQAGDFPGAMQSFGELVQAHPKEALHRMQRARAMLSVGFGERARGEAAAATKLEPDSARAWSTLGWVLQHDLIGRRFGKGFDRENSLAAYRKAVALDSKDAAIQADLAILLEHDAAGVRYSPRSQLDEAVTVYRSRAKLVEENDAYVDNLAFALFYANRFAEVKAAVTGKKPSASAKQLVVASAAASGGVRAARAEADRLTEGGAESDKLLVDSAGQLVRVRHYAEAADLMEAASQGSQKTAAALQQIESLRSTRHFEEMLLPASDPRSVIQQLMQLTLGGSVPNTAVFDLLSRRMIHPGSREDQEEFSRGLAIGMRAARTSQFPPEVIVDFALSNLTFAIEGDDTDGYRIRTQSRSAAPMDVFVSKEDGKYRLLAMQDVTPVGTMALERLDVNDADGARRLLNWARQEQRLEGGEDPLSGAAFPRLWKVGQSSDSKADPASDLAAARIAAAALASLNPISAQAAVNILAPARDSAATPELRTGINLALMQGYSRLEQWAKLREVCQELLKTAPDSRTAFNCLAGANAGLQHWDEIQSGARDRLTRLREDADAVQALADAEVETHQFEKMRAVMRPILSGAGASERDYNQFAWFGLLQRPIDEETLAAARKAYDQSQGKHPGVTHTLACVYAASGRPKEARELLLGIMTTMGMDEPDASVWYGLGLVAEGYGDNESALHFYQRVEKPRHGIVRSSTSYMLAQARIAALKPAGR